MTRWLLIIPFLTVFAALLVGGHLYIAQRLVIDAGLPASVSLVLQLAIALLAATIVLQPLGERFAPPRLARIVAWPASIWLGVAFWLLLALGATDLALWFGAAVASASGGQAPVASAPTGALRAALVGLGVGAVTLVALREGLRPPRVRRVEIAPDAWPRSRDGFRIVQISDIHIGPLLDRRFAADLVERVNELEPDLIAVTGDLVDGSVRHLAGEVAPFSGLRARLGVFFVTGNHDHYSGARAWATLAGELGMRVLRNEHVEIGSGADAFALAGVDDHRAGLLPGDSGGEDLDAALAGIRPELPVILLAHDPSTFKRAHARGIALQLSGHTHGGQIWPFRYLVRLAIPFVAGLYRRANAWLYVSRGTGFWGPPMRLGAPAEITELTLRSPDAG